MAPKAKNIIRSLKSAADAPPVAGFLEYKPGPGIYSRLERAVQQLPENVRVQELPGLLKRYKDGIPGWELKAVDFDSVVGDRTVVPRDELLAAVRERSPVFTHKEVVLGGRPQQGVEVHESEDGGFRMPVLAIDRQRTPAQIGGGVSHGRPKYEDYGQGGDDYSEVLLLQPYARGDRADTHHWKDSPVGALHDPQWRDGESVVAHLRHDTHDDALRINEIQSDIANHNIRAMKRLDKRPARSESDYPIPFPLEDAYRELLVKRALLEAARQGHRAIEVALPESISQKVGMPIEHAEHLYGKVIPSDIERPGRKLDGLEEDAVGVASEPVRLSTPPYDAQKIMFRATDALNDAIAYADGLVGRLPGQRSVGARMEDLTDALTWGGDPQVHADALRNQMVKAAIGNGWTEEAANILVGQAMPKLMRDAENVAHLNQAQGRVAQLRREYKPPTVGTPPGRRYIISDEMRKNIITKGIPAAVAIGTAAGATVGSSKPAEASPLQAASDAAARAAMPASTVNSIRRLKQQVEAAYAKADKTQKPADFKKAEALDAKLEAQYEKWDSRLEDMDEGEGDMDEIDSRNYEEQMRQIYGEYLAGSPSFRTEAELADALRGIGPDTELAKQASDDDLIREAKASFDGRQARLAKLRSGSPEDSVRAMQAQLRDLPAGALPVPIMAQAQSVNENRELPAGSGGSWNDIRKNMVGDFDFSMAISPEEWEDYYQNNGMSVEHQKFKQNVADVLGQPIIRVGAANDAKLLVEGDDYDRITPAQFVGEYLDIYAPKLDDAARAQVLERVAGKLDGSTRDPDVMADDIIDRMMGSLQASSPNGKYAKVDPMPQEQFEALKQQHGDWAESMLTPGTAENFESLRGYELLRTTMDGQHAPVYADNLSNAAAFVGGLVSPKAREEFADATFNSGPEGRFRRANRDYFGSRSRPDEPAAFRDQDGSSRFASTSATNIPGLMRAGSDVSNTIGAISWPLYESFSEFSRTPVGKAVTGEGLPALWEGGGDSQFMAEKRHAFDREQMIQPAGMSREQFDHQLASHKRDREEGEAWGATTFPNAQAALDKIAGGRTDRTWGPPIYNDSVPNFFQNTVGNIPSMGVMAGAAATGGLLGGLAGAVTPKAGIARAAAGAAGGVARGAARGAGAAAASQAADAPFDFATDQAVGSVLGGGPQNYIGYITTPESDNALLPGVDPNSMSIDDLNRRRDDALREREQRFRDNRWNWNRR